MGCVLALRTVQIIVNQLAAHKIGFVHAGVIPRV